MGLAKFVAMDPYTPPKTEDELETLLSEMHGVIDWSVHHNGEVTVEYDRYRVSDQVIEEALAGVGFKLKHLSDDPNVDGAEAEAAIERAGGGSE